MEIIGPIVVITFVFVLCWAIITTYLWRVAERPEVASVEAAMAPRATEFHHCRVFGEGSWEFVDPDTTLVHFLIAWASTNELGYRSPDTIINAGRLQPLLEEIYPNATFKASGNGSIRVSNMFKEGPLPSTYGFRLFLMERLGRGESGVIEITKKHTPLIQQVREVLWSTHAFVNGPNDLTVVAISIHDSLGSFHHYNRKIAELTGAEYVGYEEERMTYKQNREPASVYRYSKPVGVYLTTMEAIRSEKELN